MAHRPGSAPLPAGRGPAVVALRVGEVKADAQGPYAVVGARVAVPPSGGPVSVGGSAVDTGLLVGLGVASEVRSPTLLISPFTDAQILLLPGTEDTTVVSAGKRTGSSNF